MIKEIKYNRTIKRLFKNLTRIKYDNGPIRFHAPSGFTVFQIDDKIHGNIRIDEMVILREFGITYDKDVHECVRTFLNRYDLPMVFWDSSEIKF